MRLAPSDGKAIPPTFLLIPLRAQRSAFADLPPVQILSARNLAVLRGPKKLRRAGARRSDAGLESAGLIRLQLYCAAPKLP